MAIGVVSSITFSFKEGRGIRHIVKVPYLQKDTLVNVSVRVVVF